MSAKDWMSSFMLAVKDGKDVKEAEIDSLISAMPAPTLIDKLSDSDKDEFGVNLWNTSSKLALNTANDIQVEAKLKMVAFKFIEAAIGNEHASLARMAAMSFRVAKTSFASDDLKQASAFIQKSIQFWNLLGENEVYDVIRARSMCMLNGFKAIMESKLGNTTSAQYFLSQAMNPDKLVLLTPKEVTELVQLFQDYATSLVSARHQKAAIRWYQISYNLVTSESCSKDGFKDAKAKILRSLAQAILTMNDPDAELVKIAENASQLILELDRGFSIESFYIRLKLLDVKQPVNKPVLKQSFSEIVDNLTVLSKITEFHIEIVIKCAQIVSKYDGLFVYEILKDLLNLDEGSLAKPLRLKLFMGILGIISISFPDSTSVQVKEAISILLSKQMKLDTDQETRAVAIICLGAKRAFEAAKFSEAAELYKLSFDICKAIQLDEKIALLHKIGFCHLEDAKYDQANLMFDQALALERNSQSLTLKIMCCIRSTNFSLAAELCKELKSLRDCELIHIKCLLSESQQFKASDIMLDLLIFCTCEEKLNTEEDPAFVTMIRCTIRLLRAKMGDAKQWSQKDVKLLVTIFEKVSMLNPKLAKKIHHMEFEWLFSMCWNMSIEASETQQFSYAAEFLPISDRLISLCQWKNEDDLKKRRGDALFLLTICKIELARIQTDQAVKNENWLSADNALERWSQYRKFHETRDSLIYELEFEIAIGLKQWPRAEKTFDKFLQLKQKSSLSLERLTSICLKALDCPCLLVCTAIQNTLDLLLIEWQSGSGQLLTSNDPSGSLDLEKFSAWFRNLITVSSKIEGKSFEYFCQFAEMVDGVKDDYPENELIWLINSCWNKGVDYKNASNDSECRKWCSKALEISSQINDQTIHQHLSNLFANM